MKLFLDTAEIDEIKEAYSWGIIDGITTNPSLIKKAVDTRVLRGERVDLKKYISEILKVAKGTPVSLEVTETRYEGMIHQAKKLYRIFNPIAKNVVIKIPINPAFSDSEKRQMDGIRAIKTLSDLKIPVNCTLVFTPEQALLAAKAGAKYVSPFAGRVDDYIRDNNKMRFSKHDYFPAEGLEKGKFTDDNGIFSGIDLVEECKLIIEEYGFETDVLAASLRNNRQVREAALAGSDVATVPFHVAVDMTKHPKTYEGMQKFTKDIVLEYMELMNGFHHEADNKDVQKKNKTKSKKKRVLRKGMKK